MEGKRRGAHQRGDKLGGDESRRDEETGEGRKEERREERGMKGREED